MTIESQLLSKFLSDAVLQICEYTTVASSQVFGQLIASYIHVLLTGKTSYLCQAQMTAELFVNSQKHVSYLSLFEAAFFPLFTCHLSKHNNKLTPYCTCMYIMLFWSNDKYILTMISDGLECRQSHGPGDRGRSGFVLCGVCAGRRSGPHHYGHHEWRQSAQHCHELLQYIYCSG